MKLTFKKKDSSVKSPVYRFGHTYFDIYAHSVVYTGTENEDVRLYGTGLYFDVPEGYALLILGSGGYGYDEQIRLSSCVTVLDHESMGELQIQLTRDYYNWGLPDFPVQGAVIAHGLLVPALRATLEDTSDAAILHRQTACA